MLLSPSKEIDSGKHYPLNFIPNEIVECTCNTLFILGISIKEHRMFKLKVAFVKLCIPWIKLLTRTMEGIDIKEISNYFLMSKIPGQKVRV